MTLVFNKSSFPKFCHGPDFLGYERPIQDSSYMDKIPRFKPQLSLAQICLSPYILYLFIFLFTSLWIEQSYPAAAVGPHTDSRHCFALLWISHVPHLLACPNIPEKTSAWLSVDEIPTLEQSTETWVVLHMAAPVRIEGGVVTESHGCLLHPNK